MTDGERRLWNELRDFRRHYGVHVRRQAPIGRYVVDFVIQERKLIIEVDGEHHQIPEQRERDVARDAWLRAQGYEIMRLHSGEVWNELQACIETILRKARIV